jgi:hypothetical protein
LDESGDGGPREPASRSPSLGREDLERLVAMISSIGRFWISESRLDRNDEPTGRTIDHDLGVLAGGLWAPAGSSIKASRI